MAGSPSSAYAQLTSGGDPSLILHSSGNAGEGADIYYDSSHEDLYIGTRYASNAFIAFKTGYTDNNIVTNGTEHLRIRQDGFVGIGTTDPGATLDVTGNISASVGMYVTADGTGGDFNGSSLVRGLLYLNRDDTATVKQLVFYKNGSEHSYLETSTSGLNIGGGNVGIGTNAPDSNLHIYQPAGGLNALKITAAGSAG